MTATVRELLRLAAVLAAAVALTVSGAADADELYLRVGLGLDRPAGTAFTDSDCAAPAALYSCGRGSDGAPLRSVGDFGTVAAFELGLGYEVAPALRLELLAEVRPGFAFEGRANFTQDETPRRVTAKLATLSAMVAAHVDLPALGVLRLGPFSPFLGGAVGVARVEIEETRMPGRATTTIVPAASRTDFAWMMTAGLATALSERATLDLAWRYSDLGAVRTGDGGGGGGVFWHDGSREILIDFAETQARLRSHGLRLSLRYAF